MHASSSLVIGLGSIVGLVLTAGCGTVPDDCTLRFTCGRGGGAPSGGTGTGSATGGGGGGGGTPTSCVPSENATTGVADTCGVFAKPMAASGGKGTKALPLASLDAAITLALTGTKRVYACLGTFTETVSIQGGVEIYGGLDCANGWVYAGPGKKTNLTAAADKVPLAITNTAVSVGLWDFGVQALSATVPGGSSIAVITESPKVGFTRVDIVAGDGAPGNAGTTPVDYIGPTDLMNPLIAGVAGAQACSGSADMALKGGVGHGNPTCSVSIGGDGGYGGAFLGSVKPAGSGGPGLPFGMKNVAGAGEGTTIDPWGCATNGKGGDGDDGTAGMAGPGASGSTSIGTIDSKGFKGIAGSAGGIGVPGQGGGGGGGAKGSMACAGASGGGGGAGGCGGNGGTGGGPGGASIGIIALGTTLTFEASTIVTGLGGLGGNGGAGQNGAVGGQAGNGGGGGNLKSGCKGGGGGAGGAGGVGGGGRGGHSLGVALKGVASPVKGVTFTHGKPGDGGKGDMDAMHDGDPGIMADVKGFGGG